VGPVLTRSNPTRRSQALLNSLGSMPSQNHAEEAQIVAPALYVARPALRRGRPTSAIYLTVEPVTAACDVLSSARYFRQAEPVVAKHQRIDPRRSVAT
jgi:hypothetical protein